MYGKNIITAIITLTMAAINTAPAATSLMYLALG